MTRQSIFQNTVLPSTSLQAFARRAFDHCVSNDANARYLTFNDIADLEEVGGGASCSDTAGCAGHDDGAG